MEQLKVIQVRKRKPKEVARSHEPDTYDKIVERAFWFVIGFSVQGKTDARFSLNFDWFISI